MLYTLLLVLLVIDSVVLIVAVLLQAGQGGGMAASCGGLFLGLSFLLALASTRSRAPKSVLDQTFQTAPAPVSAPANPAAGGANSAIPLTPAPTTAAPAASAPATTPSAKKAAAEKPPAEKKP